MPWWHGHWGPLSPHLLQYDWVSPLKEKGILISFHAHAKAQQLRAFGLKWVLLEAMDGTAGSG